MISKKEDGKVIRMKIILIKKPKMLMEKDSKLIDRIRVLRDLHLHNKFCHNFYE